MYGLTLGAMCLGEGKCSFRVWASLVGRVEVHVLAPDERFAPMQPEGNGYYHVVLDGVGPGTLYRYRLDGELEQPDPASRFQPGGVYGPSQVLEPSYRWTDREWSGLQLSDYVAYELHVGTFTPEGTFEAVIPRLDELRSTGITALELMPVNQFPGTRNWGYDGVFPFAAQDSYGGPWALKRLVDACHSRGMAVILDVVYNHPGPEGNCLQCYGNYFSNRYHTPWGWAFNFDGPDSDEVRRFFIENAIHWVTDFHIDALRLDAVHAILDHSPYLFVEELTAAVHRVAATLDRRVHVIAESYLNDARLVTIPDLGGYGLDAQWNDDFHHALHALLTGERTGFYEDFGQVGHLAKAYREGFVFSGEYARYWQRRRGTSSRRIPAERLIAFLQNHDMIGNRALGERLTTLVSLETVKLGAAALLLSPFPPLLFMGEEYGETAPFPYFVSHSHPELREAITRGRHQDFAAFKFSQRPPDPHAEETFENARLNWDLRQSAGHKALLGYYRELLRLRKAVPALAALSKEHLESTSHENEKLLMVHRWQSGSECVLLLNFNTSEVKLDGMMPGGTWYRWLDSSDAVWGGPGSTLPGMLTHGGPQGLVVGPQRAVLFVSGEPVCATLSPP